ncbi:MAG: hypothetical protein B6247_27430 [Candidatus Parabeggiatoa sp. nov. 2]|nr:MAG: hypothetical protein B6247_27430 [Beggiatoa sp. 4572_84]
MKSEHIITVLILLTVGIVFYIGYWLYSHYEYISETVEVGFQGEARDNPLLAAERLLERMGTTAKTVHALPNVKDDLGSQDTLVLLQYGTFFSDDQTQQLFHWLDDGGHLIMSSDTLHDVVGKTTKTNLDPLLKKLRVYRHQNGLDKDKIAQAPPTQFVWAQYRLQVAFNPDYYLEPSYYDPVKEISDKHGIHFLFYYYGNGIMRTQAKVEGDGTGTPFEKIPPLWTLLWTTMWTVIISAAILLLFWLWTASRRFGSLLPTPPRARRRLLEHIEASGHFLWRQEQAHTLLHGARQALLKRLESVHPDWTHLSHAELSQRLAQVCELPADEIEEALNPHQSPLAKRGKVPGQGRISEMAFTRSLQIMTQIRKTL